MYGTYLYMCEARHLCVLKIYLKTKVTFSIKQMRKGVVLLTHTNKHILQMAMRLNIHSDTKMSF